MELQSVSSSNVAAIGHDDETNTLRVEYNNGSVYDYHGVTHSIYESMLNADSVGQYLNRVVKPSFGFEKIR